MTAALIGTDVLLDDLRGDTQAAAVLARYPNRAISVVTQLERVAARPNLR